MIKKICLLLLSAAALLQFGCAMNKQHKMLSEDIETLTVFADEIKTLKNPALRSASKEKYLAAKRLAEGVDFSLTRSTDTLEQFFSMNDALSTRGIEFGDEIAFYYRYGNNYVRFRFWYSQNAVTDSEVNVR